jgi:hypothetical protein
MGHKNQSMLRMFCINNLLITKIFNSFTFSFFLIIFVAVIEVYNGQDFGD